MRTMIRPLIIGGNSGIGLAIAQSFYKKGVNKIYIVGKDEPDYSSVDETIRKDFKKSVIFKKHNLICLDLSIFDEFDDFNSLIITAGFGRVALFENLTEAEVKNLLEVNFVSIGRLLKHFYGRIADKNDFYTAVMVSISGQLVSPFFSVYGASKAGLHHLIENLNCELKANGYDNRILDISPGFLKGTAFSGGKNSLNLLEHLSNLIIKKMFNKDTSFIPEYDEVYKGVLEKYYQDKEKFGQESYQYKINSGRISTKPQVVVGYLSGTFDLFHIGHLNLLKRAKEQCDYLIVSVHNSGAWKGKETFIPYEERKAIVESIKYVDEVVEDYVEDYDAWEIYHYNKLFVGSDYKGTERFNRYERDLKNKAEIIYFPYTQGTSSTQLREALLKKK